MGWGDAWDVLAGVQRNGGGAGQYGAAADESEQRAEVTDAAKAENGHNDDDEKRSADNERDGAACDACDANCGPVMSLTGHCAFWRREHGGRAGITQEGGRLTVPCPTMPLLARSGVGGCAVTSNDAARTGVRRGPDS